MSTQQRFSLLRKILKALGLSDDRIEELISRIQEWLLDNQAEKEMALPPTCPKCGADTVRRIAKKGANFLGLFKLFTLPEHRQRD